MDRDDLIQRITTRWIDICSRRGRHPRAVTPVELATIAIIVQNMFGPSTQRIATPVAPTFDRRRQILDTIQNLDKRIDMYERTDLLDQAMDNIPVQELHDSAERVQASNERLPCFEDALADVLVKWFRDDYFVWADRKTEKCPVCEGPMNFAESPTPSEEERRGGAGRVELHKCQKEGCTGHYRFPRYNDPAVLMRTRVGRCGEFANLFALFLRAMGLRAQYVWNMEDHVWNAYFSPAQGRWIHLDSCEAVRDQPLLYSKGWGKRMSFCLAFSTDGAMDVSRGYISPEKWQEASKIRASIISEADLEKALTSTTNRRRLGFPIDVLERLKEEDAKMKVWLLDSDAVKSDDSHLEARQSGTEEWKKARGEAGPSGDST